MYIEIRKIHLIEEVIKIGSEDLLIELETVLKKAKKERKKQTASAHEFLGLWDKKDASLIEKAIKNSLIWKNEI